MSSTREFMEDPAPDVRRRRTQDDARTLDPTMTPPATDRPTTERPTSERPTAGRSGARRCTARLPRVGLRSLAAVLVGVGAGCASLIKQPRVALAEVAVESLTLSGATIQVELEVENPNGFGLDARALEYTFYFQPAGSGDDGDGDGWRTLTSGRTVEAVNLPANGTVNVPVSIPFRFRELEEAATSLLRDGTLRYRFEGAFTVGSPVGDLRVPFDRTGLLDL